MWGIFLAVLGTYLYEPQNTMTLGIQGTPYKGIDFLMLIYSEYLEKIVY